MIRRSILAVVLALVAAMSAPAQADGLTSQGGRLTLLLTGDLDGALAPSHCDERRGTGRNLGHLAASISQARAEAEREGRTVAAVIHLGDLPGPAAIGRFLLRQPGGASRFNGYVAQLGLTHALLGNHMLERHPESATELIQGMTRAGIVVLNAGVRCEGRSDCSTLAALPPGDVLLAGELRLALVGDTGEIAFADIDPERRRGLTHAPTVEAFNAFGREVRAGGADLVIGAVHMNAGGGSFAALSRLARDSDQLDLLLTNQLGELSDSSATLAHGDTAAVGVSGESPTSVVRLDVDLVRTDERLSVAALTARRIEAASPEPGLASQMRRLVDNYCSELDRPLPTVVKTRTDTAAFVPFLLDVMREEAKAEVAVVNDRLVDATVFPLEGAVTAAQVFAALPYNDAVVKVTLPGAKLRSAFRASGSRFHWAGVGDVDGVTHVNGRVLDDLSRYSLVMPDYLARGGESMLAEPVSYAPLQFGGEALLLRDLVLLALSDGERGEAALSRRSPLDLSNRLRWSWTGALTLMTTGTRRANPAEYGDPRLSRENATAFRTEATGRADADAKDHAMRLTARMKYALSSIAASDFVETEDQLFLEALYRLRRFKSRAGNPWWMPVPYLATTLDTEFARNEGAPFRHQELGATVGVRLLPVWPLEFKAGFGGRSETLDPAATIRYGFELGYELPRFSPTKINGVAVDVESGVDYFISDITGTPQHEGRLRLKLLLPIAGPVSLTTGVDVLTLKRGAEPFAVVADLTFGVTTRFDGARQQF